MGFNLGFKGLSKSSNKTDRVTVISDEPYNKTLELKLQNKNPTGTAMILFCVTISNKICRLLEKHNVRTIHVPKKENHTDG